MKRAIMFFACFGICHFLSGQQVQWIWMSGDSTGNNFDVYGNKRVFDPINKPGMRSVHKAWTDNKGNFYMLSSGTIALRFGFDTIPVSSSALWKYSPTLNQWAMPTGYNSTEPGVAYSASPALAPGTTNPDISPGFMVSIGANWFDKDGNWWMYGGKSGYRYFGSSSALWRFNHEISQWTFLRGGPDDSPPVYGEKGVAAASSTPGGRAGGLVWMDRERRVYLYGGFSEIVHSAIGDVWLYDPATNLWTWMAGPKFIPGNQEPPGVRGASGVFAPEYTPGVSFGARIVSSVDSSDIIVFEKLGEVWHFSMRMNQWAWISGERGNVTAPKPPVPQRRYGVKGVPSVLNHPGARESAITWADSIYDWIYGGDTTTVSSEKLYFSDLWKFNRLTLEWTWVDGDSSLNRSPDFGTKGTQKASNQPGGRSGAVSWRDGEGNTWIFGGSAPGRPPARGAGVRVMNDLWKLTVSNIVQAVKLGEFSAAAKEGKVVLSWSTLQEQKSRSFIIQRSEDSIHFTTIGTLPAAGSSANIVRYNYTDNSPMKGKNYYRLQQVALDDSFEYSGLVNVVIYPAAFSFAVLKNPAVNELKLTLESADAGTMTLQVKDVSGRVAIMKTFPATRGSSTYSLPIQKLQPGLFFVTVTTGNKVLTTRFVKL